MLKQSAFCTFYRTFLDFTPVIFRCLTISFLLTVWPSKILCILIILVPICAWLMCTWLMCTWLMCTWLMCTWLMCTWLMCTWLKILHIAYVFSAKSWWLMFSTCAGVFFHMWHAHFAPIIIKLYPIEWTVQIMNHMLFS